MKHLTLAVLLGAALSAQSADTIESHVAAAKALDVERSDGAHQSLRARAGRARHASGAARRATACGEPRTPRAHRRPPDRSRWAREPMKVFDNLYYVGEREYSSWAVTTSAGIIIIDPIYDYSVEEQVVGGLKKLGSIPRKSSTSSSATRTAIMRAARGICRSVRRAGAADGARLGYARAQQAEVAEAEARHGRRRRPAAHAGRHDA